MMKAQVAAVVPVTWAFVVEPGETNRTPTVSLGSGPRGPLYSEAELPVRPEDGARTQELACVARRLSPPTRTWEPTLVRRQP